MKYIINYSSGGLGNRLKPLGSCQLISLQTERKLAMTWGLTPACNARYSELYTNDIDIVDLSQLPPEDVSIYSEPEWVEHDVRLNKNPHLYNLMSKAGCTRLSYSNNIIKDNKKYIIVYSNTYLPGYENIGDFLKSLDPVKYIKDQVNEFIKINNIDSNIVGVHARSTDFTNSSPEIYTSKMFAYNGNFYVCSDSHEMESSIINKFPGRVITRNKNYVIKENSNIGTWVNNIMRNEASVIDAIIDMMILSKTKFEIYHNESSFAEIVKLLQ
jgi:hypothetical protein